MKLRDINLNESVTFSVAGVEKPIENVSYLAWKTAGLVAKQFPDEFAAVLGQPVKSGEWKHTDPTNIITQDGADDSPEGIINFYAEKFPREIIPKILHAIEYFVPELGGKIVGEPRAESSQSYGGLVIRIPVKIVNLGADLPPEMNVSNSNAEELLGLLGLSTVDLYGSVDVRELAMKLASLTDFSIGMSAQAPEQGVQDSGLRWFDGGRSVQQVERYIRTLGAMVQWAIENHYDTIRFS